MPPDFNALIALCKRFAIDPSIGPVSPLGQGLINDTYRLEAGGRDYVLQRLNGHVFPEPERLMVNLARLARHSEPPESLGLHVPALIPTRDGAGFVRDPAGAVWRLMDFVPDTRNLPRLQSLEQASEVGRVLERANGRILLFTLGGPLIFGLAKAISRQHAVLEDHEVLILDFSEVPILGVSSSLALEKMVLEDLEAGRQVLIAGAEGDVRQRLDRLGITARLPADQVVSSMQEALARAEALLAASPRPVSLAKPEVVAA